MALTNLQYNIIKKEYDDTRMENQRILDERVAYVESHVDGYKELSDAIVSLSVEFAKLKLMGKESSINELKSTIEDLRLQKKELLAAANLPDNYLEPIYVCPDCKDTGYIGSQKCHCLKQRMISLLYSQSNISEYLNTVDFKKVSNEYYFGKDLENFSNTFNKSVQFVEKFDSDYQNMIFYGTVGTGKSLLSACIAKKLIESGHSVIYFSATALMDALSKYTFDYKSKDELSQTYSDIFECDLLIIDDLGTEMINSFTISSLFNCMNERFLRKKSIIISTNLSLDDLCDRYTDRIASRLTGSFTFCKLSGPDIRLASKVRQ